MSASISGVLIKLLPQQSGNGQNGPWKKQVFIIETEGQYAKKIAFEAWNDKAQQVDELLIGDRLTVSYNLESREYNDKWYTTAKAWKIETEKVKEREHSYSQPEPLPTEKPTTDWANANADDLPF